jgi:hypothetical protein
LTVEQRAELLVALGKGAPSFNFSGEVWTTKRIAALMGVKPGAIVQWFKDDFQLGHGHAMAIYALLKGAKTEDSD